mgnify:CR=1 FL=1
MHAGQTVEVSVVTTLEVTGFSEEEQKEALGLKVRNAVANSARVNMGTVEFAWVSPLVFASEVPVSVRIQVFQSDTFDLSGDEKVDLLRAVVLVLREARGTVFPSRCRMKFRLVEVRGVIFAEMAGGPSFCLPKKRFS